MAATTEDRPLRRDAERNRRRVLIAAREVFTERGLKATLDDVARRAGLGVGTVYRRFPGKEALAEAVFTERLDQLIALAEQALAGPGSWTGLASFIERSGAMLCEDPGLCQIVTYGGCGRNRVTHGRRRLQQAVTKLLERAQRDGAVRPDLRPTDIRLIWSMLAAAAGYARHVRPEVWRRYLALTLDGLRPSQHAISPIPVSALTPEEMEQAIMSHAKRGSE